MREKGRSWSPWFGTGARISPSSPALPDVLFQVSMGVGMTLGEVSPDGRPLPVQQVQTRLTDTATSSGSVDDEFSLKMGC